MIPPRARPRRRGRRKANGARHRRHHRIVTAAVTGQKETLAGRGSSLEGAVHGRRSSGRVRHRRRRLGVSDGRCRCGRTSRARELPPAALDTSPALPKRPLPHWAQVPRSRSRLRRIQRDERRARYVESGEHGGLDGRRGVVCGRVGGDRRLTGAVLDQGRGDERDTGAVFDELRGDERGTAVVLERDATIAADRAAPAVI